MIHIFQYAPMGAGKDFVAEYLEQHHGFLSVALADGMRSYISKNKPDYVWKSDRALEISVGEKHREWFGADFWCKYADQRIASILGDFKATDLIGYNGVIIRDGRFPHEYEHYVNKLVFAPVKISAGEVVRLNRLIKRQGGTVDGGHFYSPNDCPIFDMPGYEIQNNGTAKELYEAIDRQIAILREDGYDS
ncbi:DEAD/DEAH box helicase family protein [Paenibacillus hexagrammi]|uniref:Uncharacterized protein n=1 Tax=Paenibacillus hexagrammi TaxID=2908839 RepID=A0ABY3SSM5_9BACL|nr:hypothetical protein [Paenibacillus sp. YPD9-1]UJF36575.1 hypothetical protein L0M14_30775 [Paenibacillus sp. YPD9-1]